MKTITLRALTAASSLPAALIKAVVKQSGGFHDFTEAAPDVANYGATGGSNGGFVWTRDTVEFTRQNKTDILNAAATIAAKSDTPVYDFIAGLESVKAEHLSPDVVSEIVNRPFKVEADGTNTVYNALALWSVEEVSRAYMRLKEQQNLYEFTYRESIIGNCAYQVYARGEEEARQKFRTEQPAYYANLISCKKV